MAFHCAGVFPQTFSEKGVKPWVAVRFNILCGSSVAFEIKDTQWVENKRPKAICSKCLLLTPLRIKWSGWRKHSGFQSRISSCVSLRILLRVESDSSESQNSKQKTCVEMGKVTVPVLSLSLSCSVFLFFTKKNSHNCISGNPTKVFTWGAKLTFPSLKTHTEKVCVVLGIT